MALDTDLRAASPWWQIGDPGRAASEVRPGRPVDAVGLADIEISSCALGGIEVRAASVRGILHRSSTQPRQDAFALAEDAPDSIVAVVCDGVGSLSRSHEAADLVSRVLTKSAAQGVEWDEAFVRANDALTELMDTSDGGDSMATTAIGIRVRRDGDAWVGSVASVGDSSLWHLSSLGRWSPIQSVADEDGYYTGSVRPLPSTAACEVSPFRLPSGALFIMSDGVGNPLGWSQEVQATLAEWWAQAPDALTFAGQVGFARKSHMDDRTVVGLWFDGTRDDGSEG